MAAVSKAHIEVVPDVSKFVARLRAAADTLEGIVSGDVVTVRREDYDRGQNALARWDNSATSDHSATQELRDALAILVDNAEPTEAAS
jgi:hypothetical protein